MLRTELKLDFTGVAVVIVDFYKKNVFICNFYTIQTIYLYKLVVILQSLDLIYKQKSKKSVDAIKDYATIFELS